MIEQKIESLVNWIKEHVERTGAKGVVLGLSGGIDSAVTVTAAVKALGKDRVYGIAMPIRSTPDAEADAMELANNLGIKFEILDLYAPYMGLLNALHNVEPFYSENISDLTKGNIKARLRMQVVYAIAGAKDYQVIGTCNLSEIMIGYATKHGDGACDFEPLGNIYKTEVFEIAEAIEIDGVNPIPVNTRTKQPSADLWEGQTDAEEIGQQLGIENFTYEMLDKYLQFINYMNNGEVKAIDDEGFESAGIDKEIYDKILSLHKRTEHKRVMPPIPNF